MLRACLSTTLSVATTPTCLKAQDQTKVIYASRSCTEHNKTPSYRHAHVEWPMTRIHPIYISCPPISSQPNSILVAPRRSHVSFKVVLQRDPTGGGEKDK